MKTPFSDGIVQPIKSAINWINLMHEFTMLLKYGWLAPSPKKKIQDTRINLQCRKNMLKNGENISKIR